MPFFLNLNYLEVDFGVYCPQKRDFASMTVKVGVQNSTRLTLIDSDVQVWYRLLHKVIFFTKLWIMIYYYRTVDRRRRLGLKFFKIIRF